jgi:DNA-binding CsgD family transcriptional regulator
VIVTSWTLSNKAQVLSRPLDQGPPEGYDADARVRVSVVDALREMLQRAEGGHLEIAEEPPDGVAVVFEHANVRCVLVVQAPGARQTLSPRESQIARLIADGATNRLIASVLDISLWTVSTHIRRIFAKLGVNSRAEMVAQLFGASHHLSRTDLQPTKAD